MENPMDIMVMRLFVFFFCCNVLLKATLRELDPLSTATGANPLDVLNLQGTDQPEQPGRTPEDLLGVPVGTDGNNNGDEKKEGEIDPNNPLAKYPNMMRTGIRPKVQNIVSMFNLGTKLDLKHIGLHAKNAEYNPKRFAAVIMRIRDPKTTALIFQSGKVVVTGAENEGESKRGAKKFAKILVKLGYPAKFRDFKVQNIVGSTAINFSVRLEPMAAENAIFSRYEPELFPGLIFKMENPKVVLLIFVSGKIVFTGARSEDDLFRSFEKIYPVLCKYDKNKQQQQQVVQEPE